MTAALVDAGKKRETIRKSVKYLAAVLEDEGVDPNPARSKRIRLPHEEHDELNPPTAAHVEAVHRLAPAYRLPLLCLHGDPWVNIPLGELCFPKGDKTMRAFTVGLVVECPVRSRGRGLHR